MTEKWLTGDWPYGGFTLYLPALAELPIRDLMKVCDLIQMTDKPTADQLDDFDRLINEIRNSDRIGEKFKKSRLKAVTERREAYEKTYYW